MFQVIATFSLKNWEETEGLLFMLAGRKSDASGATNSKEIKEREHIWFEPEFPVAHRLKNRLSQIRGVKATLREHTSMRAGV